MDSPSLEDRLEPTLAENHGEFDVATRSQAITLKLYSNLKNKEIEAITGYLFARSHG